MKTYIKSVFLPLDERILSQYKGYILNGKQINELNKTDVSLKENIPAFLKYCNEHHYKVFIYSNHPLNPIQKFKLNILKENGLIDSCLQILKLTDLNQIIEKQNISIRNSLLVLKDDSELELAKKIAFEKEHQSKNIVIWKKETKKVGIQYVSANTISNVETLAGMRNYVEHNLTSKDKLFFTNDIVLFIEDDIDIFLNNYLKENLRSINERLAEKRMSLLLFPFQLKDSGFKESFYELLRYRYPVLYSSSDTELFNAIDILFNHISPQTFYQTILEELELPYFKRPALLRRIYGGSEENQNKFTYTTIDYKSKEDLNDFFGWYINQIKIPNDFANVKFDNLVYEETETQYYADNKFKIESAQLSFEIKQKIDSIKNGKNFGVLADTLMYLLETIKDEKPEIVKNLRILIQRDKLLESKVVLSKILIDKHYNIFLPEYGNLEVKMHALPKTVYLFFLRYPDGIKLKELYQHRSEILSIYKKVTNKYEPEEIERAISDLVDMRNNSINEKCARVREAFRNIMDENTAKYYYIDGGRGEPKKIALPNNLIDIRY